MQPLFKSKHALTQQQLLRQAIIGTNSTRVEFATKLGISPRRLNSWMLPDSSSGFRSMDLVYRSVVMSVVNESRAKQQKIIDCAALSNQVEPVRCEEYDLTFPTIFRQTILSYGIDSNTGNLDRSKDYTYTKYALNESPPNNLSHAELIKSEPTRARNAKNDFGWLHVKEHHSYERANAYASGFVEAILSPIYDVSCSLYSFEGRFFSLQQVRNWPGEKKLGRLTLYHSDNYWTEFVANIPAGIKKSPLNNLIMEDQWHFVLDENGLPTESYADWLGE